MRQFNEEVFAVQAGATLTSAAISSTLLFACSAQAAATSGAAGTLKIQASNDHPVAAGAVPTNWNDIPSATIAVTGAGSFLVPKVDLCYEYIRIVYTNTGAGTIGIRLKILGD